MQILYEPNQFPCYRHWLRVGIALSLAIAIALSSFQSVSTQWKLEEDWTVPENLSQSGSTADPIMIVDSEGITHVIWSDYFEEYRHTQQDEEGLWSEPNNLSVPFVDVQPRLIYGPNDLVYSFWLSERTLLYSRVKSTAIGVTIAWEPVHELGDDVLAFDVFIDEDNVIHLVYISQSQLSSQPAGVYYRQKPVNLVWTGNKEVYTSQYFRTLRSSQANVSIAAGSLGNESGGEGNQEQTKSIIVTWEEPPRLQPKFSRSDDGSKTWTSSTDIYTGGIVEETNQDFGSDLTIWNGQVIRVWKKQLSEANCEILNQYSSDGEHWSEKSLVFSSYNACPEQSGFLAAQGDLVLWHAIIDNQLILVAWDGRRWSETRSESGLTGFRDPATGKALTFNAQKVFYHEETRNLIVVGRDGNGIQDVWFTNKVLSDVDDWFQSFSSWQLPKNVAKVSSLIENVTLVADTHGTPYGFWLDSLSVSTEDDTYDIGSIHKLNYSRWDGEKWLSPSAVNVNDDAVIEEFSTLIHPSGNLLMVWRNQKRNQLFFSLVEAERVGNNSEWMEPDVLPSPDGLCSSPALGVGRDSSIYVAYAILVNEGRGIYIDRSIDGGRTWEEPAQVFDGQSSAWAMVDKPVLAFSEDRIHVLWEQKLPLDPAVAIGMGYAYSNTGGMDWVTEQWDSNQFILWSGLATFPTGGVLRVWQEAQTDYSTFIAQISLNDGETWSSSQAISSFGESVGGPTLITDHFGGIHLIHVVRDDVGRLVLRHWIWLGSGWEGKESLSLGYDFSNSLIGLSSAFLMDNQLMVLFTDGDIENQIQSLNSAISPMGEYADYLGGLSESTAALSPNMDQDTLNEEVQNDSTEETIESNFSVIPTFSTEPDIQSNPFSTWLGTIAGAILGTGLVAAVFLIKLTRKKR